MKFIVIHSKEKWGIFTEYYRLDDLLFLDHDKTPHCIFLKFKNIKNGSTFSCELEKDYEFDHNKFAFFLSNSQDVLFHIECDETEQFEDDEEPEEEREFSKFTPK